jgi:hypothetical protein
MHFIRNIDRWIALICSLYLIWLTQHYPPVKDHRAIIHDVTSYYGYLPAWHIYEDIDFGFADTLPPGEPLDALWYNQLPNGQRFQKMTLGLAYFYAPSFYLADAYVLKHPEYHRNGFSKPYQWALTLNTLLFGLISIWLFQKILRMHVNPPVAGVVMLLIFGATNLPYYISMAPGLSHVYSFFLLCVQWLISLNLKRKMTVSGIFGLVLITSWLVLIRPTNLMPALLPLLIIFPRDWIQFLKRSPIAWILVFLAFIIIWMPQFLYWKHVSGHWIFYSYDNERFFFNDPKIFEGLFGFRKGWLVYSPVMIFALAGLFVQSADMRPYKTFLLLTLPVYLWVIFSWWCWWYGGSYGSRVMIEYYPILALFMGSFVQWIFKKKVFRWFALVMACFFIWLNHLQLRQFHGGILHWDSMTLKAYKAIFADRKIPEGYEQHLDTPDYEAAKRGDR